MRHGNGKYVLSDETSFEGQWVNDVKHGHGLLTYKNGETIKGKWVMDRLNGLAVN